MPSDPAGICEQTDQLRLNFGMIGEGSRTRQQSEGQRLQSVSGKNRRRLIECTMSRGATTSQVVVVHAGRSS